MIEIAHWLLSSQNSTSILFNVLLKHSCKTKKKKKKSSLVHVVWWSVAALDKNKGLNSSVNCCFFVSEMRQKST